MTKAEILEAINATISPNGVKGITAESLANILTEIVNATPEGGSGGEYIDMTTPSSDDFDLSEEAKAHNAELYNKLLPALNSMSAIPTISVYDGMGSRMYASSIYLEEIEGVTSIKFGFHALTYGAETNYEIQGVNLSTSETTELYIGNDLMLICLVLHQDGSVTASIPGLM